jgi:nucleotide-binding universal stress UspA family protein
MNAIRSIVHPTDFSDLSVAAFAHALRIALAARSKLHLLHVSQYDAGEALAFPHARRLLAQWGLSDEDDPPSTIASKLGIEVDNIRIKLQEPTQAIVDFLSEHESDLVVLATHGRDGVAHWLQGSVAEAVFRRSTIPTLFIAPGARGFVDQVSGDVQLKRVLVPVDFSPPPGRAIAAIQRFGRLLTGANVAVDLLHVGDAAPPLRAASSSALPRVILRSGNVVKSIVDAAIEFDIDAIAMPTAGHHGVLDALRGSTTERVIRHAPCPVFALSAASLRSG